MREISNIYTLSIKFIQTKDNNTVKVLCETCNNLADYFVNKGGREKYLCKNHLHSWLMRKNVQYHVQHGK